MRPFPKLKPCLWDGLVALLVAAMALACAWTAWNRDTGDGALTAVVSVDGNEVERLPLGGGTERTYRSGGYTLRVVLTAEGVRVEEADCPTQDCVHTGTIRRPGQSIVCLPARVIIRLEGGTAGQDDPDVVIG